MVRQVGTTVPKEYMEVICDGKLVHSFKGLEVF